MGHISCIEKASQTEFGTLFCREEWKSPSIFVIVKFKLGHAIKYAFVG